MDVAVVGAGRVGTALAVLLLRAGHVVTAISGRHATAARAARYLPGVPVLPAAAAASSADPWCWPCRTTRSRGWP